ncbi:MAG: aldolase/citrate lyase family protein, partial [Bauldia sp.]
MRSLLLVAADSDPGLDQVSATGADIVVVDIATADPRLAPALRRHAAALGEAGRGALRLFVRINPLSSGLAEGDLDSVMPWHPHGIVLPAATGGGDVTRLSALLRPREAMAGIEDGATAAIAMAGDTAAGLFGLGSYRRASARLLALGWDRARLLDALGVGSPHDTP